MVPGALVAPRGCGKSRKQGGIYLEAGLSPNGSPFEEFIVDPPIPINCGKVGITPKGVSLIEIKGVTHVFDWVGAQHYPNVLDWVNESKLLGISRLVSSKLDFSRLTKASRLFVIHPKAFILNIEDYLDAWRLQGEDAWLCPMKEYHRQIHGDIAPSVSKYEDHCPEKLVELPKEGSETDFRSGIAFNSKRMCIGIWERDLVGEKQDSRALISRVDCITPSVSYSGYATPANVAPQYHPAVIGIFPISRIAVVSGGDSSAAKPGIDAASASQLPVDEVDE